jgi:hypothetical protein
MSATSTETSKQLEDAMLLLCKTDAQRALLRNLYQIAFLEGERKVIAELTAKARAE